MSAVTAGDCPDSCCAASPASASLRSRYPGYPSSRAVRTTVASLVPVSSANPVTVNAEHPAGSPATASATRCIDRVIDGANVLTLAASAAGAGGAECPKLSFTLLVTFERYFQGGGLARVEWVTEERPGLRASGQPPPVVRPHPRCPVQQGVRDPDRVDLGHAVDDLGRGQPGDRRRLVRQALVAACRVAAEDQGEDAPGGVLVDAGQPVGADAERSGAGWAPFCGGSCSCT